MQLREFGLGYPYDEWEQASGFCYRCHVWRDQIAKPIIERLAIEFATAPAMMFVESKLSKAIHFESGQAATAPSLDKLASRWAEIAYAAADAALYRARKDMQKR